MMYKFMTLDDKTEIVHSDAYIENNIETVKVYFEKPVYGGFHHATCYLPKYEWEDIYGFSDEEMDFFKKLIISNAHVIIEFSQEGKLTNADCSSQ